MTVLVHDEEPSARRDRVDGSEALTRTARISALESDCEDLSIHDTFTIHGLDYALDDEPRNKEAVLRVGTMLTLRLKRAGRMR